MKKFVTIFPNAENIHLIKDIGMIPYTMYKEFGYKSSIACYKNGEYSYLYSEVKGLNIDFIKKHTSKPVIDVAIYLLKNAKDIDVLHLFHFGKKIFVWVWLYKLLNRNGKVYLKLDANRTIKDNSLKNIIKKAIFNKCDLVSVETKELYDYLNQNWPVKVELIPNGFIDNHKMITITPQEKENYIITVGRIGSAEKANETLMEAFAKVQYQVLNWKLKLIGPIEDGFEGYIDKYFITYPMLKDRVIFTDAIYDKKKLDEEYRRAKIFCLTSPMEGFPLVFLEAIKSGCYIISSDVSAAYDVTDDEKYGDIFRVGDVEKLSYLLVDNCTNSIKLDELYVEIQQFAYKNFNWKTICEKISFLLS
jgi:glycosyltransferase involved in cell wall biosynthesis